MTDPAWGTKVHPWPISAGDLDAWDYYVSNDEVSAASFLERLNRVGGETLPMVIGKAFHSSIELAMMLARDCCTELDVHFDHLAKAEISFTVPNLIQLPSYNIIEQDVGFVFDTPSGWVELRGVIDGLRGNTLKELKTTRSFKAERYQDSWQWRAYLSAMGEGYDRLDYEVFQVAYGAPQERAYEADEPFSVEVRENHTVSCWRYPDLLRDLRSVCSQLAGYLETIGWVPPAKRQMDVF